MRIMKRNLIWILLLIAALAGMALAAYATSYGPGVGGDATIYLTSAKNFLAGKGLGWTEADGSFRLLPYTPPFYPLVLSGFGLLVKDMAAGARWLNVLMFGATVALAGWFFYRCTGRAWLAGILSGVLATSPVILGIQVWAMSESLFLLLGLAGLLLMLEYLAGPKLKPVRARLLVGSAVLCGLAFLTRYMGVAFVITAGLALVLLERCDDPDGRVVRFRLRSKELREGLLFGSLAALPILAWLVIDFSLTGTVGSRSGQPAAAYWQRFLEIGPALQKIYLFWLLPDSVIARLPGAVQVLLWLVPLAGLVGLSLWLARRLGVAVQPAKAAGMASAPAASAPAASAPAASASAAAPASAALPASAARLAALFGLFILVYLLVLAVVQVFTYPPITLASRMLSPVHLAFVVLLFALLHLVLEVTTPRAQQEQWAQKGQRTSQELKAQSLLRPLGLLVYLGCLALLGTYLLRSALIARDYHRSGIGYNSAEWQHSTVIEEVKGLPPNTPLISNETTALMYLAGRPAYALQEIYQSLPQEKFTRYGEGDDAAQRVFRYHGGALVLFNGTLEDDFGKYGDRAAERIQALTEGLKLYYQGEDGAIYFTPAVH